MIDAPQYEADSPSRLALLAGAGTLLAVLVVSAIPSLLLNRAWWPTTMLGGSHRAPLPISEREVVEAEWRARAGAYVLIEAETDEPAARVPLERAIELRLAGEVPRP